MGITKVFVKTPETLFALEAMRDKYWHNMAIRIQRAWRNYLRYRIECAIRIQRFWRRMTGGLEFIKIRDQGHKVLQGRKERRRMSLLGSRRFLGDYLGVGNTGGPGEMIRNGAGISGSDDVIFSCRAEVLVSKFGRSSKPVPRILVLTNRHVYVVAQSIENNQLVISSERTVPVGAIKSVGTSNLKDDWFSLVIGAQEPDPLIHCVFKTEFFTHLTNVLRGSLTLKIGETIEYHKKPGKLATVKAVKDPGAGNVDSYKSSTIHTSAGEPPSSVSKPTPRPKAVAARPVTTGKLLRPGGPGGGPSKLSQAARRPVPAAQPLPRSTPQPATQAAAQPHTVPQPRIVPQSMAAAAAAMHSRNDSRSSVRSSGSMRAPPPPPAAPPPASRKPAAKVKYDYSSDRANELSITKGEIVEVVSKEGNGTYP